MDFQHFLHHEIFQIGLVVIGAIGFQLISRTFIERLVRRLIRADYFENSQDEKKREDTVISLFHTTSALVVWGVAVCFILGLLHVNVAGLATGAGLFGVIFGLGLQSTIKNYLAGFFILTENQYRVGDMVTLAGGTLGAASASGVVEEITLRITKLRDINGTVHTVRNGDAGTIVNRTYKFANVIMDITVGYDTKLETFETLVNELGKKMLETDELNKLITTPITYLYVESFSETGAVVRVMGKVKPGAQWKVAGEFRGLLKETCSKQKITLGASEGILQ